MLQSGRLSRFKQYTGRPSRLSTSLRGHGSGMAKNPAAAGSAPAGGTSFGPGPGRPLRADARRNRQRVLEVAFATFAAEGLAVPVHEIARRAGLGTGTVSRAFPHEGGAVSSG